ncbi:hypothetical protein V8E53_012254 [Lactarius tabidus]
MVHARTVTANHVNLVAWHGTSVKQLARPVTCVNSAKVLDWLFGVLNCYEFVLGDRLSLECITPKSGVDHLAVAKKQKSDACVEETHMVNMEMLSPLAPPDSESQNSSGGHRTGSGSVHWRREDNRGHKEVIVLAQIGLLFVGIERH